MNMARSIKRDAIEIGVRGALVMHNACVEPTGPEIVGSSELQRAVVVASDAIAEVADFWDVHGVLAVTGLAFHSVLAMHVEEFISAVPSVGPETAMARAWDVAWEAEARRAADAVMAAQPRVIGRALARVGADY
jgi:hypothetical protein